MTCGETPKMRMSIFAQNPQAGFARTRISRTSAGTDRTMSLDNRPVRPLVDDWTKRTNVQIIQIVLLQKCITRWRAQSARQAVDRPGQKQEVPHAYRRLPKTCTQDVRSCQSTATRSRDGVGVGRVRPVHSSYRRPRRVHDRRRIEQGPGRGAARQGVRVADLPELR
jgi:hypothetical protein